MPEKKKHKVYVQSEKRAQEAPEPETGKETAAPAADENPIAVLEQKLAEAQAEVKEAHDRFLRAAAELENFKKRTQKELDEFRKFANESLVKELLNVVDNLERAVEAPGNGESEKQIAEGVDLTLKELLKILKKFGVEPIASMGKPFDPAYHQAMMQQEVADQENNIVINEMQKGYLIHDRLLRPAMVVVSKAKDKSTGNGVNAGEIN